MPINTAFVRQNGRKTIKKTGTSEWRNGGNWNECIMNKTSLRQQASLSESDIKFILSTEKCAEQNCAAHDMELGTVVYTLRSLLRNPTSGQNSPRAECVLGTTYEWVVGESMDMALEKGCDGRLLTPRGAKMENGFFSIRRGCRNGANQF